MKSAIDRGRKTQTYFGVPLHFLTFTRRPPAKYMKLASTASTGAITDGE